MLFKAILSRFNGTLFVFGILLLKSLDNKKSNDING